MGGWVGGRGSSALTDQMGEENGRKLHQNKQVRLPVLLRYCNADG